MASDQLFLIDPARLAVSGERLEGQYCLADMPRLRELVLNREGTVDYVLTFKRDDQGVIRICGDVMTRLVVLCQRCLNEMEVQIANKVNIGFSSDQEKTRLMPDFLEPYVSEEKEIPLGGLIEEEIMLGLPLSPMHSREDCPASQITQEFAVKRENPFAVLKSISSKNQSSGDS